MIVEPQMLSRCILSEVIAIIEDDSFLVRGFHFSFFQEAEEVTESFEDVQNALNQVLKQQGIWRDFLQQISESLEGIFLIANEKFSFVRGISLKKISYFNLKFFLVVFVEFEWEISLRVKFFISEENLLDCFYCRFFHGE